MLYISEVNWRTTCLLLSFSMLNKVEGSQMPSVSFKLSYLSYSLLPFKSVQGKKNIYYLETVLSLCVKSALFGCWSKTQWKACVEGQVHAPHCSDARAAIRKCVAFVCLCYHIKYFLLIYTHISMNISLSSFCFLIFFSTLAGSLSYWCFCSESYGYSKG